VFPAEGRACSGSTWSQRSQARSSGLCSGGLLAPVAWRLVFLVSVPCGPDPEPCGAYPHGSRSVGWFASPAKIGLAWQRSRSPVGLIALLVGITYGILPYGGHTMGWTALGVIARDRAAD